MEFCYGHMLRLWRTLANIRALYKSVNHQDEEAARPSTHKSWKQICKAGDVSLISFPQDGNYGNLATISAEDRALRVGDVFVTFPQHGSHGMGYQSWGKGKVKAKMEEASIPKCDMDWWGNTKWSGQWDGWGRLVCVRGKAPQWKESQLGKLGRGTTWVTFVSGQWPIWPDWVHLGWVSEPS